MRSSQQPGEGVGHDSPQLMVLDEASPEVPEITAPLESRGYRVVRVKSGGDALHVLRRTRPALTIVGRATAAPLTELRTAAREMGIPVLDLVDSGADLMARLGSSEEADDWVIRDSSPEEIDARVARLLRRSRALAAQPARPATSPIDVKFSALVVHDLRTPLNVIGLSLHMIEQALPKKHPDLEQDIRFVEENFRQIERMLSQLGDYARLFERGQSLTASEFDPRRLVDELLENRKSRPGWKGATVRLDIDTTCPKEVRLDQKCARMAIEYALVNADAAAHDEPIHLRLRGAPHRWLIEIVIDRPPPSSVSSMELGPQSFERLCGCAADRRGMDLAIAARISEMFGGTARLEALPGRGTSIILDWPARIDVGA